MDPKWGEIRDTQHHTYVIGAAVQTVVITLVFAALKPSFARAQSDDGSTLPDTFSAVRGVLLASTISIATCFMPNIVNLLTEGDVDR